MDFTMNFIPQQRKRFTKISMRTTFQDRKIFKYKFNEAQVPVASLGKDNRKHQLTKQRGFPRIEKKDSTGQPGGCLQVSLRIQN